MFIDIVFLLLMLMACVKGYSKGFVVALFSILGFIAGLAAALKLSAYVAERLSGTFNASGKWLPFLSFILVFVVVVLLVSLGAKLIQKSLEMVLLGWVNRLAGIVLYALLYSIFFSVFLFYAEQLHILSAQGLAASTVAPYLKPFAPAILEALGSVIPIFKGLFNQLQDFFGKVPEKVPA
jgi:membrane protein required for colicin V production